MSQAPVQVGACPRSAQLQLLPVDGEDRPLVPTAVARSRFWSGAAAGILSLVMALPGIARAQNDGAIERTVVTQDGAMYRGEVREYVVGDHITLKLDTGEVQRIQWADAVQISPPRAKAGRPAKADELPRPPPIPPATPYSPPTSYTPPTTPSSPTVAPYTPPAPPPSRPSVINSQPVPTPVAPNTERTVVLQSGMSYNGEVVEFESGSHILLNLASGERRRIPWAEAKRISPPHTRGDTDPGSSPERIVVMPDGTNLRGDLVESLIGEYTILKMPSGQLRRINWKDAKRIMNPNPTGKPSTIPITGELLILVDNGRRIQGEYFEYVADDHLVLRHQTGGFRIIPVGTIKKITLLGENSQ